MDALTRKNLDNLKGTDRDERYAAFQYIIKLTQEPVDWAYEVWDDLLKLLKTGDNHERSIAAQVLSNLAKSDPQKRMLKDFGHLISATKDERFVTARHSLQSLWKVGVASKDLLKLVTQGLAKRFKEAEAEKNTSLIRYDIIEVFRKIYDKTGDEKTMKKALALIETEEDMKYRKKYAGLWKGLGV